MNADQFATELLFIIVIHKQKVICRKRLLVTEKWVECSS